MAIGSQKAVRHGNWQSEGNGTWQFAVARQSGIATASYTAIVITDHSKNDNANSDK